MKNYCKLAHYIFLTTISIQAKSASITDEYEISTLLALNKNFKAHLSTQIPMRIGHGFNCSLLGQVALPFQTRTILKGSTGGAVFYQFSDRGVLGINSLYSVHQPYVHSCSVGMSGMFGPISMNLCARAFLLQKNKLVTGGIKSFDVGAAVSCRMQSGFQISLQGQYAPHYLGCDAGSITNKRFQLGMEAPLGKLVTIQSNVISHKLKDVQFQVGIRFGLFGCLHSASENKPTSLLNLFLGLNSSLTDPDLISHLAVPISKAARSYVEWSDKNRKLGQRFVCEELMNTLAEHIARRGEQYLSQEERSATWEKVNALISEFKDFSLGDLFEEGIALEGLHRGEGYEELGRELGYYIWNYLDLNELRDIYNRAAQRALLRWKCLKDPLPEQLSEDRSRIESALKACKNALDYALKVVSVLVIEDDSKYMDLALSLFGDEGAKTTKVLLKKIQS